MEIIEEDDKIFLKTNEEDMKNPERLLRKIKPIVDKKIEEDMKKEKKWKK